MSPRKQAIITFSVLLTIVLIGGLFTYFVMRDDADEALPPTVRERVLTTPEGVAPYTDLDGNELELEVVEDQMIVAYSWASWCVTCADDLVRLNALAASVENERVRVLAFNRAEDRRRATQFLRTLPELSELEIILDEDDNFFDQLEGYAVPEVVVLTPLGEEAYRGRGTLTIPNIQAALEEN